MLEDVLKMSKWYTVPALYLFVRGVTPTATAAFASFVYSELHLAASTLSALNFLSQLGGTLAILLYWLFCEGRHIKKVLIATTLLSVAVGLLQIVVAQGWAGSRTVPFLVLIELMLFIDARLVYQPLIILVTIMCPPNAGAFIFASLFSIENFGNTLSGFITAEIADSLKVGSANSWSTLWWLIAICEISKFLPLVILAFMPVTPPVPAIRGAASTITPIDFVEGVFILNADDQHSDPNLATGGDCTGTVLVDDSDEKKLTHDVEEVPKC